MITFSMWLFWVALAFVLGPLVLLPALALASPRRKPGGKQTGYQPSMSLIVCAFDEQEVIVDKVANCLSLNYPEDRVQVIVASDGSTDDTVARARSVCSSDRLVVLDLPRRGKNHTLNAAVEHANGDVLVFTDADSTLEADALCHLVEALSNTNVGAVGGDYRYFRSEEEDKGQRSYWSYDRWLKSIQSSSGSMTSATGQLYAIRRSLFAPVPAGVTDDFFLSTQAVSAGQRLVFQARAGATGPNADPRGEYRRRVRITTRGLRSVWARRELLNPVRYGRYSLQLFLHKVARRLMPPFLALLAFSAGALWREGVLYAATFTALASVGLLGAIGLTAQGTRIGRTPVLGYPAFVLRWCLATFLALFNILVGRSFDLWSAERVPARPATTARNLLRLTLLLVCSFASNRSPAWAETGGYITTAEELAEIRQLAAEGAEPWKTTVSRLQQWVGPANSWAYGDLNGQVTCVGGAQPYHIAGQGNGPFVPGGGPVVLAKVYLYHLTGQLDYAQAARERLLDLVDTHFWGGSIYHGGNPCILNLGWFVPRLIQAADLLEGSPAWSSGDKLALQQWLATEVYKKTAWSSVNRSNNWGSGGSYASAIIADYLIGSPITKLRDNTGQELRVEDAREYHTQRQLARMSGTERMDSRCPTQGIQTHGGIPDELRRGSAGCNGSYLPTDDSAHGYQMVHLAALVAHSEMMRRRGDLRLTTNLDGGTGRGSIEKGILFVIDNPVKSWPVQKSDQVTLELAYSHYGNTKMCALLDCKNSRRRPEIDRSNRVLSFTSLTHTPRPQTEPQPTEEEPVEDEETPTEEEVPADEESPAEEEGPTEGETVAEGETPAGEGETDPVTASPTKRKTMEQAKPKTASPSYGDGF